MSYFAIHVKSGWESHTIDVLQRMVEQTGFYDIESVFAPILELKQFKGQNAYISKKKMLASSYIYIKIQDSVFEIPSKVYHFIKSIGSVLRVLPYDVPEEEVEAFCNNYGLALNEAEIELHLEVEHEMEDLDNEKNNLLHEANFATAKEEKMSKLKKIEEVEGKPLNIFNFFIERARKTNNYLINKCKVVQRHKKEVYSIPLTLFIKTRKRIDPYKKLPISTVTNPTFLLPHILKTMEHELSIRDRERGMNFSY